MIAVAPQIVIAPTPTTGLPANSSAGAPSGNPFSAALQAATQNLLHPSPKSKLGAGQTNSPTNNSKTGSATENLSALSTSQGAMNTAGNSTLPVQGPQLAAVPIVPSPVPLQPGTIDEAKLQTATLGAEQNQSAVQIARIGTATTSAQVAPSATPEFQQLVSPQVGSGTQGVTGASALVPSGSQTAPLVPALPEFPLGSPQGSGPNPPEQLNSQPPGKLDQLSAAGSKKEADPLQILSPNTSGGPVSQPAPSAHTTKPASQPVSATPQAAGNTTPTANDPRSVPNQPEHSGGATDTKNQTAEAAGASAAASSTVPQIPLQSVMPDINAIKASPKPTEVSQTAPALSASPATNGTQSVVDTSRKNGDAGGSGNYQSGAGKGSTSSSFQSMAASNQPVDNTAATVAKVGDISSSSALGTQAVHAGESTSDGPAVTAAKTSTPTAEIPHSPATGTPEADARMQAAATYANSLLHSARLVERMGQTELRVGVQTGEFGNVDIRTSMVRNQFTAQISAERGDLGKVLAAELPNLQNKLSEQRLPMANITLQNQSSGSSAGSGQGSRQSQTMQQISIPDIAAGEIAPALMSMAEAGNSSGRLDVHM